jgi:hypothetical protein
MYEVRRRAVWITRLDRASRLSRVPPENVLLVESYREKLNSVLPAELLQNPFEPVADPFEEKGVPFEELPETGSDDRIVWDGTAVR